MSAAVYTAAADFSAKYMSYPCPYVQKNGEPCGWESENEKGCFAHAWKPPVQLCAGCSVPTNSMYGRCSKCSNTIRMRAYRQKKKLDTLKARQIQQEAEEIVDELLRGTV